MVLAEAAASRTSGGAAVTESPAPIGRRLIDVSALPNFAFGHRDPIWWGLWLLIAIEGTMFVLLASTYFYLRGNASEWPPTGAANPPFWITVGTLVSLLVSVVPTWWAFRAALEFRLRPIQIGFLLGTIASFVATGFRAWEFATIGYQWNSHAYGSIVWSIYFMHSFHLVSGTLENVVMTVLLFKGPIEKKLMPDIRLSVIYWWFVVVTWVPFWALILFDDLLFRNSFVS
jgi:heme/copper-type cytochrome/quinol oxidase subunit 3